MASAIDAVVPPRAAPAAPATTAITPASRRLDTAFERAVSDALDAAASVEHDPVEAVHSFRRNVRRARAILAAASGQLPEKEERTLFLALATAIHQTGALRDRDVLPSALSSLPVLSGTEEARAEIEGELLAARLHQRRGGSRAHRLAVAAVRLAPLPDRLRSVLAPDLSEKAIGKGLSRMARRARRAVYEALAAGGEGTKSHRARRRVRLLASALDALVIEGRAGRPGHPERSRTARRAEKLAQLSKKLGETLDLELLADYARTRSGRNETSESRKHLLAQLERRSRRRRLVVLERAERLLARRRWKPARIVSIRTS